MSQKILTMEELSAKYAGSPEMLFDLAFAFYHGCKAITRSARQNMNAVGRPTGWVDAMLDELDEMTEADLAFELEA